MEKEQIAEEIIGKGNYILAREVWLEAELAKTRAKNLVLYCTRCNGYKSHRLEKVWWFFWRKYCEVCGKPSGLAWWEKAWGNAEETALLEDDEPERHWVRTAKDRTYPNPGWLDTLVEAEAEALELHESKGD